MKTFFIRLFISLALLGVIFLVLAPHVHPDDIRPALSLLSWPNLFLIFFLSILISLIKAKRFHLLIHRIGLRISFWQSCKIFFSSQATTLLPGGEMVRAILLKKETHAGTIRVAGPVVAQAILELIAAVTIVLLGSLFYPSMRWLATILFLLLVPFLVFMFYPTGVKYLAKWIMKWKRSRPWCAKLLETQNQMHGIMFSARERVPFFAISVVGLAFVSDAIGALLIFTLSSRLSLPLHFFDATYLYAISVAISGLLWIIPGGLGVTEGGMVGLLSLWQVPFGKAISLVVIFRLATLLFPVFLGLMLLIIFYGKPWLVDLKRRA